jgi:DNA-binding transcriptional LysR family regulator
LKQAAIDYEWSVFAPAYVVQREVDAGHLVAVDVPDLVYEEELVMLWRQGRLFSPLQQAVSDAVSEELS